MHLILNDGSGIPLNTKSKRKILIKAALVYEPHWGSNKKVVAYSLEFTVLKWLPCQVPGIIRSVLLQPGAVRLR